MAHYFYLSGPRQHDAAMNLLYLAGIHSESAWLHLPTDVVSMVAVGWFLDHGD
jgi:hypothetical protein